MYNVLSRGHWNCATFDVRKENSSDLLSGSRRNIIQFFGSFVWPATFLLTPWPLFSLVASFRLSGAYVSHTTSTRLLWWSCCWSFDSWQTVDYYCAIQDFAVNPSDRRPDNSKSLSSRAIWRILLSVSSTEKQWSLSPSSPPKQNKYCDRSSETDWRFLHFGAGLFLLICSAVLASFSANTFLNFL